MPAHQIDAFMGYMTDVQGVSPHTAEAYGHDIVQFCNFLGKLWGEEKAYALAEVDYPTIRRYLAHLNRMEYTHSTIARKLTALRALYRHLVHRWRGWRRVADGPPRREVPRGPRSFR